jgi:hypothetical protein
MVRGIRSCHAGRQTCMAVAKQNSEHIVAVGKRLGSGFDLLARGSFDRKSSAVDLGRETLDDHTTNISRQSAVDSFPSAFRLLAADCGLATADSGLLTADC